MQQLHDREFAVPAELVLLLPLLFVPTKGLWPQANFPAGC